jgi:hypothetical protein
VTDEHHFATPMDTSLRSQYNSLTYNVMDEHHFATPMDTSSRSRYNSLTYNVTDEHHFATPMDTTISLLHGISSHRGEHSSSRRRSTFASMPIQLDNHSSSALLIEKSMPSDQEHATYLVERDLHQNLYPDYNTPGRTTDQIETHAIQHFEKNKNDHGRLFEQALAKSMVAYPTTVVANPVARRPRTKKFTKGWTLQEDTLYLIKFRKYGNQFSKYTIQGCSACQ